jgi:hypothetical protein
MCASLTITFRANQNGGTHAAGCRHVSARAADTETLTIAAFRAAGSGKRPCQACGGGILASLSAEQRERIAGLVPGLETRLQQERENAAARRRMQELIRRADAIDERARRIVDGWHWYLEHEKDAAAAYPAGVESAGVACSDWFRRVLTWASGWSRPHADCGELQPKLQPCGPSPIVLTRCSPCVSCRQGNVG